MAKVTENNYDYEDFDITPDTIQSSMQQDLSSIKDVESIEEVKSNDFIQTVDENNKKNATKKSALQRLKDIMRNPDDAKEEIAEAPKKERKRKNKEVIQTIETATNVEVPETVDAVEAAEVINQATEELKIPTDKIIVTESKETSDTGFLRPIVTVDPNEFPNKLNQLTALVLKESQKKVRPRPTEVRVICHTNEIQLKNSPHKLSGNCVTYKPKQSEIRTNKGTRMIVCAPENSKDWLVYLSHERNHKIFVYRDAETHLDWLSKRIVEFFVKGMEIVEWKFKLRESTSPLLTLTDTILGYGDYLAKPTFLKDDDRRIGYVLFKKKKTKNSWLRISVIDKVTHYEVKGFTTSAKPGEAAYIEIPLTDDYNKKEYNMAELDKLLKPAMDHYFDLDEEKWYEYMGFGVDAIGKNPKKIIDKLNMMKGKLTFKPLKNAMENITDMIEDEIEDGRTVGIHIDEVIDIDRMSKSDLQIKKSTSKGDLRGESIVGGTDKCEFTLTYMLMFLKEKDKRDSASFITSQKYYYNKQLQSKSIQRAKHYTDSKDHRPAEERDRALAGRGQNRNYHSGDYVFLLEYKKKTSGKVAHFIGKTFEEVLNKTGFLSEQPRFNVPSDYDKYFK